MNGVSLPLLLLLLLSICCGCGSKVRLTVKIIDDLNRPVPGAQVFVMGLSTESKGRTDDAGSFLAHLHNVNGHLDLVVRKEGFHTIGWVSYSFQYQTNGRWEPWNPTLKLQLRRKGNPTALFAKAEKCLRVPIQGKPIGYDLMAGDWVAPYGKGSTGDFIFTVDGNILNDCHYDGHLALRFSNPDDGLILLRIPYRDEYGLRLPAIAPDRGYSNLWEYVLIARQNPTNGYRDLISTATEDDNYYFRVRSRTNPAGHIASAMYGKVYYGIRFEPGFNYKDQPTIMFDYYLNPDGTRNTEWDTRSNLCPNPGDIGSGP